MTSLCGAQAEGVEESAPKTEDAVALTLAVKSTPSLNNAFNRRKTSHSRATSKFFTMQQQELPTGASAMTSNFDKPANLNILSHDDLANHDLHAEIQANEKSRPMTTKIASRRFTHQPIVDSSVNEVHGIYERHTSPQKSVMQIFGEQQRLNMARLSVPKNNRRRERFSGTQNSMFHTFTDEGTETQIEQ